LSFFLPIKCIDFIQYKKEITNISFVLFVKKNSFVFIVLQDYLPKNLKKEGFSLTNLINFAVTIEKSIYRISIKFNFPSIYVFIYINSINSIYLQMQS
jgi:hypothetical protein